MAGARRSLPVRRSATAGASRTIAIRLTRRAAVPAGPTIGYRVLAEGAGRQRHHPADQGEIEPEPLSGGMTKDGTGEGLARNPGQEAACVSWRFRLP